MAEEVAKGGVIVPESMLKKQKRAEEWEEVKKEEIDEKVSRIVTMNKRFKISRSSWKLLRKRNRNSRLVLIPTKLALEKQQRHVDPEPAKNQRHVEFAKQEATPMKGGLPQGEVLFFSGTKLYVKVKPVGSTYVTVVQVFVAAIKKRRLDLSQGVKFSVFDDVPGKSIFPKLPYTNQFRFLEKVAIITKEDELNEDGVPANQWELCSMQQVEQVKCLIRILPVWISGIIYFVFVVSLMQIYVVFEAQQIDRRVGGSKFEVPSASFVAVSMMAVTIFLPIYDRIVVPTLRRITKNDGGITMLQRIGFGMIISIPTLILSGVIEEKRGTSALESGHFVSPMSWMWLVPQMAIAGLSDAFAIVGLFEFYYKQVPDNMKSLGGSFFFCGMAMSSYLT
ncbi:hypothetical protein Droror1_Dr00011973 [Drosera rotundifolia]